jgi:imidazolonepropionase-like amidohydrolase
MSYRMENGRWFDGERFVARTVFVRDGRFADQGLASDSIIDLHGGFALPPFSEAHNHHFMVRGGALDAAEQAERYVSAGIFYARSLHAIAPFVSAARSAVAGRVDIASSTSGITGPGGHPTIIFKTLARNGMLPGWTADSADDRATVAVRDSAELAQKWPLVLAASPTVVKVYLERSNSDAGTSALRAGNGLDPILLPIVARMAAAAGLPLVAHVLTAADFRTAVRGGVSEIAHLPIERLTAADAQDAGQRGVAVTTTTLSHRSAASPRSDSIFRENILLLRSGGVRLLIGTDDIDRTAVDEAMNVRRLGAMSDTALLATWITSAQQMFPNRKVGAVSPGYEASFIVLRSDPLTSFDAVRDVGLAMKDGYLLRSPRR